MANTTPDDIYYRTGAEGWNAASADSMQASSVQAALNKRQQYTFVWANAAARNAQQGMSAASTGYQTDTSTSYFFENNQWRVATPYAEFTSATVTSTTGGYKGFGSISINAGASTSTTFAQGSGNSILFPNPGIYSISAFNVFSSAINGFIMLGTGTQATTDFSYQISRENTSGDNVAMLVMPFYLTVSANQRIYFYYSPPATMTSLSHYSTIRIGRLG